MNSTSTQCVIECPARIPSMLPLFIVAPADVNTGSSGLISGNGPATGPFAVIAAATWLASTDPSPKYHDGTNRLRKPCRSGERGVGEEGRSRGAADHLKKKKMTRRNAGKCTKIQKTRKVVVYNFESQL